MTDARLANKIFVIKDISKKKLNLLESAVKFLPSEQDQKNPRLHESVLLGEVTPEHLATMTTDEMASDEMKKVRERLAKEAFDDHQLASFVSGTHTDQFQCSNCKKYNSSYNEVMCLDP